MDFDAALMAVQNNSADVMLAGLSYSKDRDEVVDFTDSYATGIQSVIVKEGSDVTMDNLGDYMIGTQRGTTGFQYATDDYGEEHVIGYDNGATAVQELINGTIDAVIIDNAPAQEYVAANPTPVWPCWMAPGWRRTTAPLWTRATGPAGGHQHRPERADL